VMIIFVLCLVGISAVSGRLVVSRRSGIIHLLRVITRIFVLVGCGSTFRCCLDPLSPYILFLEMIDSSRHRSNYRN